ncbi:hypothetical protein RsS62_06260 [Rhizobium dioscoreae]|nr:hypothetical protein RsS62_06260 [Rhizobium dioscoreae]
MHRFVGQALRISPALISGTMATCVPPARCQIDAAEERDIVVNANKLLMMATEQDGLDRKA